jgi:chemotaxis protein methyltransferase CheR
MTPAERAYVARLCAERAGLAVDPDKDYLLESRLAPVARREGFGSVGELLQAVRDRQEERLVGAVVEVMAVPETAFFRHPQTFEVLRDRILPELARARGGEPVRIWCAACGAGQEVYSLAMMLEDAGLSGPVELFASDLSARALEKAQSGLYTQFEVQRGLPARLLVRNFEKREEMFAISPRIRQLVRWRRVNLTTDITRLGRFEVVVCRNLVSALTEAARPAVLRSLASAVRQNGALVLSPGDAVDGAMLGLNPVENAAGVYTRVPAVRAAA